MNPAFIILLVLAAVLLFFYAAPYYKILGDSFYRLFKKAKDEIEDKDEGE